MGEAKAKSRLEVVSLDDNDDESVRTFVLHNEDHTLGNALRYMIMKNPDVEFCGYSIPHPSENKINLRIQTKGPTATSVLKKGLNQLNDVTEHVLNVFETSVQNFKLSKNYQQDESSMDIS